MFLGIEIGGTKLQLGLGPGDGTIVALWRGKVNPAAGGEGIRQQITAAVPELLAQAKLDRAQLQGVGIGFGGPVDDATRTVIKSHQIEGWDNFPLADWIADLVGLPAVLGNDADVAGLAEALHGAGKGLSPIFYITVGSGIGGGLIIDGEIYRGAGRGAAEIGHIRFAGEDLGYNTVEHFASGWSIEKNADKFSSIRSVLGLTKEQRLTPQHVLAAAEKGDRAAIVVYRVAIYSLAIAMTYVIALLC